MKSWMQTELTYLSLGDKRRDDRFRKIVEAFAEHPASSVPQASKSWYQTKAAYEFWKSAKVSEAALLESIVQGSAQRAGDHRLVLCVQDTSNICFGGSSAEGLGYLDHGRGKGVLVHSSLGISEQGVPLGLVDQQIWVRPYEQMGKKRTRSTRPIQAKESGRWIRGMQACQRVLAGVEHLVHIADREADIYELFASERCPGSDLLIRATHNRCLADGGRLWERVSQVPAGRCELVIELQKADGRPARQARLQVKWAPVRLRPPSNKGGDALPLSLQGILVEEPHPPGGGPGLCWKLLTSLPISVAGDALRYVRWYSYRWIIERFHYTLKSGCRVEELQLRQLASLRKALITFSLVAWRLMWLLYESRVSPQTLCDQLFEEHEWQALYSYHHKSFIPPEQVPSLGQVVRWIAMLGGFLGRSRDGSPGLKNLWRGIRRLQDLAEMWLVFEKGTYPHKTSFG